MMVSFVYPIRGLLVLTALCSRAITAFTFPFVGIGIRRSIHLQQSASFVLDNAGEEFASHGNAHDDDSEQELPPLSSAVFPNSKPPFLAIVTEPNACDNDQTLQAALQVLKQATSLPQLAVHLISVRMSVPSTPLERADHKGRVVQLVQQLMEWSAETTTETTTRGHRNPFRVVVSSDWMDVAVETGAHGVHFKETHQSLIPELRRQFHPRTPPLIGTSTHSIESALDAWKEYQPDYFFTGTCYYSQSHPEKSGADLEGPALPGMVRAKLQEFIIKSSSSQRQGGTNKRPPPVLAIGGIDASNCKEPIEYGAQGVAVIRAVFEDSDPAQVVAMLQENMKAVPTTWNNLPCNFGVLRE